MKSDLTLKDMERLDGNVKRDFEMMLRRVCQRLRKHEDPKVQDVVAQVRDLLARKGAASILRDDDPDTK